MIQYNLKASGIRAAGPQLRVPITNGVLLEKSFYIIDTLAIEIFSSVDLKIVRARPFVFLLLAFPHRPW